MRWDDGLVLEPGESRWRARILAAGLVLCVAGVTGMLALAAMWAWDLTR